MNLIRSILRIIRSVILSLFLICLVVFMVNNRDDITIHLYPLPFEVETKVFLMMILFFIFGMLFGLLACSQNIIKRIFTSYQDHRKIKKLEKQVEKK